MIGAEAVFLKRNFGSPGEQPKRIVVNSMQWSAIGGPQQASISVAGGTRLDIWEAIEYLRRPVDIYDEFGRHVWNGYVSEARVRDGVWEIGATIASMANRIAVAYSYVAPGTQTVGQRKTTPWAQDSTSVNEFGIRELLSSQSGMSDAAAVARRDAMLAARRWPGGVANPFGELLPRGRARYSGARESQSANLICEGWWSTLDWRYATVPSVTGPSYPSTSAVEQTLGNATGNTRVMQQVTIGSQAVNLLEIRVYGRKIGAPVDNLTAAIYAVDGSGNPTGSALASGNLTGSNVLPTLGWHSFALSSEVQLSPNTVYALQVSRSGGMDAANCYAVGLNYALGYPGGVFRVFNGSAWVSPSPDGDMPFVLRVNNQVSSTQQIRELIGGYGQFFTGVDIAEGSGIKLPSYRDGDTTVLAEIEALLASGGANGRRLLASVDRNRRVQVREEAAATQIRFALDREGGVRTLAGAVPEPYELVGQWARIEDVIPQTADTRRIMDPTVQFVEGVTWSRENGVRVRFAAQPSVDNMQKVQR